MASGRANLPSSSMTRNAAQIALSNPDLVHILLSLIYEKDIYKEKVLARLVRTNKTFYAAGIPLLYQSIYLGRLSSPVRLRCLEQNTSLGLHVRRLHAAAVSVEQLDQVLRHLPSLTSLNWEPLASCGGIIRRLPSLPESLESLSVMRMDLADRVYRYDLEALKAMVAPLRKLDSLIAQDFNLHEILAVLQAGGKNLATLFIDRTYERRAGMLEAACWPLIFDSLPAVRSLAVFADCPASALSRLPPSVEKLILHGLDPTAILEVTRRLKEPDWLPRLNSLPTLGSVKWNIQNADRYGYDYLDALPSKREASELAAEAIAAFRERQSGMTITERDVRDFHDEVLAASKDRVARQWQLS